MTEVFVPVVSVETSHAMGKEVEKAGEKQYVSEWIRKIGAENPCVCEFLNLYVGDSPDPVRVIACGALIYAMLSNQGHIDKLASVAGR